MSRYYDPATHRFINADGYFQAGNGILGANMSAYCGNNPVNFYDPNGTKECPIHHEYWSPTCLVCRPDYAKVLETQALKSSNGRMFGVALGSIKDVSYKGWSWRIDSPDTSTKTQRHIHITSGGKVFSQNEDGSPREGSKGIPPKTLRKYLKESGVWDWDQNESKYLKANNSDIVDDQRLPLILMDDQLGIPINQIYFMPLDIAPIPALSFSFGIGWGFAFSPAFIL